MKTRPLSPAAKKLAEGYVNLARKYAGTVYRRLGGAIPKDELLSFAYEALVKAAGAYDPVNYPNVPFAPYATICIAKNVYWHGKKWLRDRGRAMSLDSITNEHGDRWEPPDTRGEPPDLAAEDNELVERVKNCLPRHWFDVVKKRYLDGLTLEAVGKDRGVSKEAVRQMENRAIKRAQEHLNQEPPLNPERKVA